MSSYEAFQMEKYGNVLNAKGVISEMFENRLEEQDQLTEWFNQQAELKLIEKEK